MREEDIIKNLPQKQTEKDRKISEMNAIEIIDKLQNRFPGYEFVFKGKMMDLNLFHVDEGVNTYGQTFAVKELNFHSVKDAFVKMMKSHSKDVITKA